MSKKVFISLISLVVGVGFLGVGVWWYTTQSKSADKGLGVEEQLEIPDWWYSDRDGDGISDSDEDVHGTSTVESDTDGDGISDKLEIEVYKTDPANPDTDGDGFPDGLEIIQGYDPLIK